MGTASFAVPTLERLLESGFCVCGVITAPDKPSGRGKKIKFNPIKEFALQNNLSIFQPTKLREEEFVEEIKGLKPDIQVVVAFRMLPEVIWKIPPMGTLNLHASLLPQYRGAAPINHAIFNGEKFSGVTTFLIDEKIDTGQVLKQSSVEIKDDETAGELHDRLMKIGADLVIETIKDISSHGIKPVKQSDLLEKNEITHTAPKIFKDDCRIDWNNNIDQVYNQIRGLNPIPSAFTILQLNNGGTKSLKIFRTFKIEKTPDILPGHLKLTKNSLQVACKNGYLDLIEIQMEGKKKMDIKEFLRGFDMEEASFMA